MMGERGERGDQGVRGDTGLRGADGKVGHIGLPGLAGPAGESSLLSPTHVARILRSLRRLMIIVVLAFGLCLGYIERSRYQGCERGKKDRLANAAGWRVAQTARTAASKTIPPGSRLGEGEMDVDERSAVKYRLIANDLLDRSNVSCSPF
jgi:hypothetical protein